MADPALQEILANCYRSTQVCAKTLFPDSFYSPFSDLHKQIFQLIDSGQRKIAIAAPRGLGKTTIARTLGMKGVLFRDVNFISYVSNSATAAEMQTENMKRELKSNTEIRKIFGDIQVSDNDDGFEDSFAIKSWVAFGNTLVMPRGAGQQVRGLIWKNHRPQLIIVDDLEDKNELMNEDNRKKLKEWFLSDLMKSVNRYLDDWRVIYIDTLKHEDSILQMLLESKDWASIRLSLCDSHYNSLVPEYISTEELLKEVDSHREKGALDVFYMEYMNVPVSAEDASFKQENFRYYNETDEEFVKKIKPKLESIVIVDPAKTVKIQSAETAIVGVGLDYETPAIYFRDCVSKKMFPDEIYDEMFAMKTRLNAHTVGIEVTGLEEFIKQPIKNEIQKRGPKASFQPVWLKARGGPADGSKGKIKRIGALVPFYRQGYVFHNHSCCAGLEAQLLMFPRSKLLDIMDAFAYVIEMMELGERYFNPPDEDQNDVEAEFAELEYEEPITNWRYA
uniref:Putative terminase n=1 Tax=viral metagenome TaxID=1070528 RepID=A0A6M3JBC9_9ZZZZ